MERKRDLQKRKLEQLKRVHDVRRVLIEKKKNEKLKEDVTIHFGRADDGERVVSSKDIKRALRQLHKKGRVIDLRKESIAKAKEVLFEEQEVYPEIQNIEFSADEKAIEAQYVSGDDSVGEMQVAQASPQKQETLNTPSVINQVSESEEISPYLFWMWPKKAQRSIAVFTILALLFSFSVKSLANVTDSAFETKDSVVGNAELALDQIKSASSSLGDKEFSMAEYKFNVAAERFFASKQEIDSMAKGVDTILALLPGGTQVNAAENLLEAGGHFSVAGEYIAKALEPFNESQDIFQAIKDQQTEFERETDLDTDAKSLTEALSISKENLEIAVENIQLAEESLNKVNSDKLPSEIAEKVDIVKEQVPQLSRSFSYFMSYADVLLEILGHDSFKRYLILFQNNTEIRPGGGFIGTYAQVDINEGKITYMKVEGPYNVDGQLKEKIKAPEALRLINDRFYMRDSNWFADYPTSAQKAAELYEKTGNATVDGVISVNATVLVELLKLVGPVDMPEYEVTIDHENFFKETQREVELTYDKELNRPKKFISDLIPKVLEKLMTLDREKWVDALVLLTSTFDKKEVMMYFSKPELQQIITDFGWGGEVKETDLDYLNIVNTNVGGGKTDLVVDQNASIETAIQSDGSVVNTVTLTKFHSGDPNDFWERVKNVNYVRFYVPKGSELIEAKGFDDSFYNVLLPENEDATYDPELAESEGKAKVDELSKTRIYTESGKTVFGNFMGVEVGMTKVVQIKYRLPFKVQLSPTDPVSHYTMLFQKQSGANPIEVEYLVTYPWMYLATWQYLTDSYPERKFRRLEADFVLDKDKTLAVVFSQ